MHVSRSWAGKPWPNAALSAGALACLQGMLLPGRPLTSPSPSPRTAHNANIPKGFLAVVESKY